MRWYVSRAGETVGPVEESQIVAWVQGGMLDAMVRDEAGGPWTPLAKSPFAPRTGGAPSGGSGRAPRWIVLGAVAVALVAALWALTNPKSAAKLLNKDAAYVRVECAGAVGGFSCSLVHERGEDRARSCWDLVLDCRNGTVAQANACSTVEPGGRTTAFIPFSDVKDFAACDTAVGAKVTNMQVVAP